MYSKVMRAALVLACAVPVPCAEAQSKAVPRIGVLSLLALESDERLPAFVSGLGERGYVEGKTISIEWRSASGDAARLPALVEDLMQHKVDMIVAVQAQAVEAARRRSATIPIVFALAQDPVGMGWARTLSRPGGNITGTSSMVTDVAPKQLELLHAALPSCKTVALLVNPTNAAGAKVMRVSYLAAARALGIQIMVLEASSQTQIEQGFAAAAQAKVDAVVVGPDAYFIQARRAIADYALAGRLPTMFIQRDHALAGGMMSYGLSPREGYRRAAYYVDRILKGARPADLPIEQPTLFELVVNRGTARKLGVTFPSSILARADQVID